MKRKTKAIHLILNEAKTYTIEKDWWEIDGVFIKHDIIKYLGCEVEELLEVKTMVQPSFIIPEEWIHGSD